MARILVVAALITATALAQDRRLPDATTFLAHVRARLRTDRTLLTQYTYLERRRDLELTKFGNVKIGPEKVFQVYPGLDAKATYRRLIEVDGKPRDPKALEDDDLKRQRKVVGELARRQRATPADRAKRERRAAEEKREDAQTLDDLFRVFDFRLVERQVPDGRSMIVVAFDPRRDAAPQTGDGKLMKKVKGRAWVCEDDYEVARVEFETLEDVSRGLFLAKLYKGTTASVERRRINDEVWLPFEVRFNGFGRAFVHKFQIDSIVRYSDYKKFSVETDTAFTLPK